MFPVISSRAIEVLVVQRGTGVTLEGALQVRIGLDEGDTIHSRGCRRIREHESLKMSRKDGYEEKMSRKENSENVDRLLLKGCPSSQFVPWLGMFHPNP